MCSSARLCLIQAWLNGSFTRYALPVADDKRDEQPKQKTRPKKGKPIEIPVPRRGDFDKLLNKAAKRPPRQHQQRGR